MLWLLQSVSEQRIEIWRNIQEGILFIVHLSTLYQLHMLFNSYYRSIIDNEESARFVFQLTT